ncbi:MAG: DUF4367 domain-containing protein [Candidatus Eiseniibacteriota bacterium]
MDDRMLHEYRRDPDPEFARNLRERLSRQEGPRPFPGQSVTRVLAFAALGVALVALFAIPSVRVSAQALLDLFRVRRFAAVQFSESRLEALRSLQSEKDRGLLVLDRKEEVLDPGPARLVPSRAAASPEVGFSVSGPGYLPEGMTADSVLVEGAGAVRLSISEAKLRALLDRLDLRDVTVPTGLDGRWIEVRKPPIVIQKFHSPRRRAVLVQARSPEVSVPTGWDVERLAEIGLRVLGLDSGEARRIARSTDWRSTLLVPVPMNASTFRQVTVHGQQGLMITTTAESSADGHRREGVVLMWTEGERVFCLQGNISTKEIMQMAESLS